MPATASHTAILLFIRAEHEEARTKSFLPKNYSSNLHIAKFLNRKAVRLARQTGLPTIVWTGEQQQGLTFGDRFSHAIQYVFQQGYQNVIAIGNDCLHLTGPLILEAAEALRQHALVLGPDQHGGAYLIGINRSAFDPESFAALPWQESQLFAGLRRWSKNQLATNFILPSRADLNRPRDLQQILKGLPLDSLKSQLLRLLGWWNKTTHLPTDLFCLLFHPSNAALRAPPFSA